MSKKVRAVLIAVIILQCVALAAIIKNILPSAPGMFEELLSQVRGQAVAAEVYDDEGYAYEGRQFSEFIETSFGQCGGGPAQTFYNWIEKEYATSTVKYPGREALTISELLEWKKTELAAITDPAQKTKAEMDFALWTHKMVKGTIRKFSLDRGFEFCYTVKYGERQCHLQSVLIAGMLQRAGLRAGVAIVYKNIAGQDTNNGHVVPMLKLSDGRDILVDASDPEPFVQQKGLLVRTSDYVYLRPV